MVRYEPQKHHEDDVALIMRRVRRIYWTQRLLGASLPLLAVVGGVGWLGYAVSWGDVWHNLPPLTQVRSVLTFVLSALIHTEWSVLFALATFLFGVVHLAWRIRASALYPPALLFRGRLRAS